MSGKFSNKTLGILFAVLLIVFLIFYFTDTGKNERTFRDELVNIDTASVTEIKIYPKTTEYNEVRLFKVENNWKVQLSEDKIVSAPLSKIQNILKQLIEIKPKRLAARGSGKWKEFEVDSTGTRIKVLEDGDETLDIVLGRFAFKQPRSMTTFVRLFNDTDVYEVDGFLAASFNQDANSFRDNTVINSDYEKWSRLSFHYPADSSVQLVKMNDQWFANDEPTDSAKTVRYLRSIQRLTNSNFIEDFDKSLISNPLYKLVIESEDSDPVEVSGFIRDSVYVVYSTMNPESYFDGNKVGLGEKIFVGLKAFFPDIIE
ncbi:DUF4340 domain-containing protein [Bacteroidota bacterium]